MYPTFQEGDWLFVESPMVSPVQVGDVVVFETTNLDGKVILAGHRVVARAPEGDFITQGDNAHTPDLYPVPQSDIIGKVCGIQRQDKDNFAKRNPRKQRIVSMYAWRLYKFLVNSIMKLNQPFTSLAHRFYHALRGSGLLQYLSAPFIREIHLLTPHGPCIKYTLSGRTIAVWYPVQTRFICHKPYDLFVSRPSK